MIELHNCLQVILVTPNLDYIPIQEIHKMFLFNFRYNKLLQDCLNSENIKFSFWMRFGDEKDLDFYGAKDQVKNVEDSQL